MDSTPNTVNLPVNAPPPDEDEISLIDLATALGEEKRVLFGIPIVTTLVAIVYALLATPIYTAKTVFLPPQKQQSGASAALASLGVLAGVGGGLDVKSPEDMYIAFLKSNTVKDDLIKRLNLKQHYESKTQESARKALGGAGKFTADKKAGLMTIEVDDKDPAFAARLANSHVEALSRLMGRLAVAEAQQRRIYFEQQIKTTQEMLNVADNKFRSSSAKGGLPVTDVLAQVSVTASATLRGQITAKEVELSAMRRFATEENPDMQIIASQLSALQAQLAKVEEGGSRLEVMSVEGHAALNALRDVKTQQAVLEMLVKQYELARADESKTGPLLHQIDIADVPKQKSKPKRAMIVLLAGVAGLFMGVLAAFVRRAWRKASENPESSGQLNALKHAWTSGWLVKQKSQ